MAHQVLTILELAALLEQTLGASLSSQVRIRVFSVVHNLRHVVPVDLELGNSGFLSENVPVETLNNRRSGRVLVQLWCIVLNVDVVAHSEELLAILVAASKKHSSDADNITNR